MQYKNSQYVAAIEVPLFGQNEFSQVKLDDNGTIRTVENLCSTRTLQFTVCHCMPIVAVICAENN